MLIHDPEDFKIKTGSYTLPIYKMPVENEKEMFSVYLESKEENKDDFITFSLFDPTKVTNNLGEKKEVSEVSSQFKPNFEDQYNMDDPFNLAEEKLDIFIDEAKWLPDNTTMSKISARVVDFQNKPITTYYETLCNPHVSVKRSHKYGLHIEGDKFAKPLSDTALVHIIIETVSISSKEARVIGQSYFPLFMDKRN